MPKIPDSVSNWQPSTPTKSNESLLMPNAKDGPEAVDAKNPLEQTVGGKGTPPAPYGKKGRLF